jgi:exosome complex RNA-binding protein Rrp4
VVGIIDDKGGDYYRVNIFSGSISLLSRLGFEGASKRNKPELKVGDVVYCKVTLAHKHLDTELTCISSSGVKKGWSSGEAVSLNYIYWKKCRITFSMYNCICILTLSSLPYLLDIRRATGGTDSARTSTSSQNVAQTRMSCS